MNDLLYKVALTKIPQVGAVTSRNLLSYCGGVREVFNTPKEQLLKIPGIGEVTAGSIVSSNALDEAEKELDFIIEHGITPLFFLDKGYPQRLRNLHDAPLLLYYKGTASLNYPRIISIVGTRTPTPAGIAICEEILEELAAYKPLVVSGLAYGIDITAHRKSLHLGLETVGVLGHGLSRIYPAQHKKTAMEMIERGGLLTEFASHVGPERENFPMRNRIVAALADAVLIVETAARGGSIITAQQANGYSRDVFAIPGRVKDKFSQGCNYMIKKSLAMLCEKASDIANHLKWPLDEQEQSKPVQKELFTELTQFEKDIIDILQKEEELEIDKLGYLLKINNTDLATAILNLEFMGLVRSLPGKRYVLN